MIDVGCAEGYYAVGLAYRMPLTQVYAYDTDFISRRQTLELATLNLVNDRVHISGFCSHSEIKSRVGEKTLLFCDVEGFERELLDPIACPSLCSTDILVEIHENAPKLNTLNLLSKRFQTTHTITELSSCLRIEWIEAVLKSANFREVQKAVLESATNEHRPVSQKWLWMRKK